MLKSFKVCFLNFFQMIGSYLKLIWIFFIWWLGYTVREAPCQHCGPETFACGNGNGNENHNGAKDAINCTCIPIRWRCDGDVDCLNDSSDEIGCGQSNENFKLSYLQVFLSISFDNISFNSESYTEFIPESI